MIRAINTARSRRRNRGTTVVELAVVMPVFGLFLAAIMEFGHVYLVIGALNSAAKQSARIGAAEGVTTAEVTARATEIVGSAINVSNATIDVKDGTVFDVEPVSVDEIVYADLPDIELETAESLQMYIVRIEVPYDDVALLPPFWAKNLTLVGQSAMRRE